MTTTTEIATTQILSYATIEDCLGPAASRFFGAGFRRVGHTLADLAVRPAPAGGEVTATAGIRYPEGWSVRDARDAPKPHLSTIDTLTIAVQAAEAYLIQAFGLIEADRRRMWLRSYTMRAGTKPQEDLAAVPVRGSALHTIPVLAGLCRAVTTFDVEVGLMRVRLEIEHDLRNLSNAVGRWADAEEVLGAAEGRYFGRGFRSRSQEIRAVDVDIADGRVVALIRSGAEVAAGPDGAGGFAAEYEPSLSMVDAIVALAQLAQAVMYGLDGVERKQTGTLWMRRMAMSALTPYQPLGNAFVSSLSVAGRRLDRGGVSWRVYEVAGSFQGISSSASLAYTVHS